MAYGAHRGWRMRFTGNPGYVNIYELSFLDRNVNRVPNIGQVIESGHYGGTSYPPENAFDGNSGTLWSGQGSGPGTMYLGYFYDAPVALGYFRGIGDSGNAFVIEHSDDNVTWTATAIAGSNFDSGYEIDGFTQTIETNPHAWWREVAIQIQNNNYHSMGELRFLVNGVNVATGGAAISIGQHGSNGYPTTAAFDGDVNSFWLSNGAPFPYLGYHFTAPVLPDHIELQRRSDGYGPDEAVRTFAYQWSDDGINWRTSRIYSDEPVWNDQVRNYDVLSAPPNAYRRKWRLRNLAWSDQGTAISISEVELRSTVFGPDVATGGQSFAQNYNTGYPPGNAFNDYLGDFWLANSPAGVLGYIFPVATDIVQYTIRCRSDYPQEGPKSWVLEYSEANGSDWTQADSRLNEPSWSNNETRTYLTTLPAGDFRRRRYSPGAG